MDEAVNKFHWKRKGYTKIKDLLWAVSAWLWDQHSLSKGAVLLHWWVKAKHPQSHKTSQNSQSTWQHKSNRSKLAREPIHFNYPTEACNYIAAFTAPGILCSASPNPPWGAESASSEMNSGTNGVTYFALYASFLSSPLDLIQPSREHSQ